MAVALNRVRDGLGHLHLPRALRPADALDGGLEQCRQIGRAGRTLGRGRVGCGHPPTLLGRAVRPGQAAAAGQAFAPGEASSCAFGGLIANAYRRLSAVLPGSTNQTCVM
ncbi:hypothetical protein GCM10023145_18810 [Angustibacter luteus]